MNDDDDDHVMKFAIFFHTCGSWLCMHNMHCMRPAPGGTLKSRCCIGLDRNIRSS